MLAKVLPQIYPLENEYHVILANGEFPHHTYLHNMIINAQSIICCDGAVNKLIQHNIIGDCDSLHPNIQKKYADKITTITDQSSNDLAKALNLAKETLKIKHIIILGATGLREDHTLGNIALLLYYLDKFATISMISDFGIFTPHHSSSTLLTMPGQQISFFSLNIDNSFSCEELKWPLRQLKLNAWNSGTLNEATGERLTVHVTHPAIVYRAFEIKLY